MEKNLIQAKMEDLRKQDLEYYDKISIQSHHWCSSIPRAINFYYDMNSDIPLSKEDIEELGWIYHLPVEVNTINFIKGKAKNGPEYSLYFNESKHHIGIIEEENNIVLFNGKINNKSELKKLMQMLNITTNE